MHTIGAKSARLHVGMLAVNVGSKAEATLRSQQRNKRVDCRWHRVNIGLFGARASSERVINMTDQDVFQLIENHPEPMHRLVKVIYERHKRFKHTGFVVGPFGDHANPDQSHVFTVSFPGRQRAVTGPAIVLKPSEEQLYAAELEPVQPPAN